MKFERMLTIMTSAIGATCLVYCLLTYSNVIEPMKKQIGVHVAIKNDGQLTDLKNGTTSSTLITGIVASNIQHENPFQQLPDAKFDTLRMKEDNGTLSHISRDNQRYSAESALIEQQLVGDQSDEKNSRDIPANQSDLGKSQELIGQHKRFEEPYVLDRSLINALSEAPGVNILPEDIRKVVIVAYYRGGSTFVGDLFNQRNGTFYWFEPLMAQQEETQQNGSAFHLYQTIFIRDKDNQTRDHLPEDFTKHHATILTDILNCRFNHLDSKVLLDKFAVTWGMSRSMMTYRKCAKIHKKENKTTHLNDILRECVGELQLACDVARLRVIKVIRLGVYMVPYIYNLDPHVKIIHYVRDPRGIAASRLLLGNKASINQRQAMSVGRGICERMRDDLQYSDQLLQERPKAFMRVRYEDLSMYPMNISEIIYHNIGMRTPREIITWLQSSTRGSRDNGGMGTLRKNSTTVALKWKTLLSVATNSEFQHFCSDVIRHLKYDTY